MADKYLEIALTALVKSLVETVEDSTEDSKPSHNKSLEEQITAATNDFAGRVTSPAEYLSLPGKEPENIERANLITEIFSKDAVLRATVSQVTRTNTSNPNINQYFKDYFSRSNIEGLAVANANYNIQGLSDNIALNIATVKFVNAKNEETTAEMTFVFVNIDGKWLIRSLDSNVIFEDVPDVLRKQGDVFTKWALPAPYGSFTVKNSEESSSLKARETKQMCQENARENCDQGQWKTANYKSYSDCKNEEFNSCYNFSIGDY